MMVQITWQPGTTLFPGSFKKMKNEKY